MILRQSKHEIFSVGPDVMGNIEVWAIPIVSGLAPSDESLLATLSIALQLLGKEPIYYDALKCSSPPFIEIITPLQRRPY